MNDRTLRDQHGEWCTFCLQYFDGPECQGELGLKRHYHHVLPGAWITARFGKQLDFRWIVPAHEVCHRVMQPDADASKRYLDQLLAGARTVEARDRLARYFHERGFYWFSVLINLHTLADRSIEMDAEERWRRCRFLLSSAAGIRGAQNLPHLVFPKGTLSAVGRPDIQLSVSNLAAARGHNVQADLWCDKARTTLDREPRKHRDGFLPALFRREAQVRRSVARAREAVGAAESFYSENTALVLEAILALSDENPGGAEDAITELQNRRGHMSWLYEAEICFMLGLHGILTDGPHASQIYGLLCKAQYLYVVLGLQMTISPELSIPVPQSGKSWDWTPSDVLCSVFDGRNSRKDLDRASCVSLRRSWLRQSRPLYEELVETMTGGGDAPGPADGYTQHLDSLSIDLNDLGRLAEALVS